MGLTPKQENFCIAYLETGNASEAYRRSYSKSTKWTEPALNVRASRMLDNAKIVLRLAELRAPALAKLEASQEKTIKRLMQGQEFDIRRLYHPADHPERPNQLKQPYELDDDTAKAVIGVKYDKDTGALVEYKIIDVKGCAELVGKHLKIFTEKHEFTGKDGGPIETKELSSIQRAARISHLLKSAKDRAKQEAPKADE